MAKVSCDIIQDMLPLYYDDVCSADSRKMIEEHIRECEVCSNMLHQLKSEYTISVKEREENKESGAALGKIAHSWKHSLLRSFLIGISITAFVLSIAFGIYHVRYVNKNSLVMVSPEDVSISGYMLSDTQISFRIQPTDGYSAAHIDTYVDGSGNLYIAIQRKGDKEELPEGENEVVHYGFNQSNKNYSAVYYGTPDNCKLIWKQGDELPTGDTSLFE